MRRPDRGRGPTKPGRPKVDERGPTLATPKGTRDEVEYAATMTPVSAADPVASARKPFAPGARLAGNRYTIERLVGKGGMGSVYLAIDEVLGKEVALKVVDQRFAADLERLRDEVLLAQEVTHRNVCRTYDLEEIDGLWLVKMEYVPGQTLGDKVAASGPLPEAEVCAIARDIANGLSAAHERGVVHRDLKPHNILIEEETGRVVLTDFGLARLAEFAGKTADNVAGTPEYMAPEQARGREVDGRADLYALGCVIFFMLTGRAVFPAKTAMAAALAHIQEPAPALPAVVPERLRRLVARLLEKEPGRRPARAEDVVAALAAPEPRRAWILAAAVAVAVAFAGLGIWRWRSRVAEETTAPAPPPAVIATPPPEAPPPQRKRRAVAVMGFRNLSGRAETAWLSTAFGELLANELGGSDELRIIPGETVVRAKTDLALADADGYGAESLARLRRNLDADYLVVGSYLVVGEGGAGRLRLDVKVQDAATGESVASVSESGTPDELLAVVSSAGEALRDKLGLGELSPDQADAALTSLPARPDAARRYAEGLARLRSGDSLEAEKLLARAAALEPGHPLIALAHAGALADLGRVTEALAEAKRAFASSAKLSRDERIEVEALYRRLGNEWPRAIELYRTLVDYHPGELEPLLDLADAQNLAGMPEEALATLAALRKLPAPASEDPRIDLAEANIAYQTGDFARARDAGARAVAAAEARGARQLAAHARLAEGGALQDLGEIDRARALIARAKETCAELGLRSCLKDCLNAEDAFNLPAGKLAEGARVNRELLAADLEDGDLVNAFISAHNLAFVLVWAGDLPGAREVARQLAALDRRANLRRPGQFMSPAMIETAAGQLARAERLLTDGDAAAAKTGDRWLGGYLIYLRGILLRAQGDLAGARKTAEAALAAARELEVAWFLALAEILIAEIAIDDGRAGEVEAMLRPTLEATARNRWVDLVALAQVAVARARLAVGDPAGAAAMAAQVAPRVGVTENVALRFDGGITLARIRAAGGKPDDVAEAQRALGGVEAGAVRLGFVEPALAARLALAELEPEGRRAAALAGVEKEARARGYLGIARAASGP